jgi:hypothetical protein
VPKGVPKPEEAPTDIATYLEDPLYKMCRDLGHTWGAMSGWQQIYNHPKANAERTGRCTNKVGKRRCKYEKRELANRSPTGKVTIFPVKGDYKDPGYLLKGVRLYPRDVRAHDINKVFEAAGAAATSAKQAAKQGGVSPRARVPRKAPSPARRRNTP